MTTLESACDNLYMEFANQGFKYWFGGPSYAVYIDKSTNKRKDTWNSFLNKYLPKYQQLALSDNSIQPKFRNSFFHSLFKLTNDKNKTIAYTPWYSAFLRVFFGGGDLVIVRNKKNYTPFSKRIKKVGKFLGTSIKLGYNYLKK